MADFVESLLRRNRPVVLRGADDSLANRFRKERGYAFQSGLEAAIDLTDSAWHRPSLRELARRALRFGSILRHPAVPFPDVTELRQRSPYAHRPALKGLYLTEPMQWNRGWSFAAEGRTLGLVTVSRRGEAAFHTEILMRDRHAPKGTMEALILQAAVDLKAEGASELSLGECPFVQGQPPDVSLHLYGHLMRHAYHAKGLYKFKAKFSPHWRPVYLCSPRPLLLPLVDLFFQTGSAALFFSSLLPNT